MNTDSFEHKSNSGGHTMSRVEDFYYRVVNESCRNELYVDRHFRVAQGRTSAVVLIDRVVLATCRLREDFLKMPCLLELPLYQ